MLPVDMLMCITDWCEGGSTQSFAINMTQGENGMEQSTQFVQVAVMKLSVPLNPPPPPPQKKN